MSGAVRSPESAVVKVRWRTVARGVVTGLVGIVVFYWCALFVFQRELLFPMPDVAAAPARPSDAVQVWLPIPAGRVEGWYLPPLRQRPARAPVILFFHGNGEVIDFLPDEFEAPRRFGVGVFLVEFPGYGRSDGAPSQDSITSAALSAYDWAGAQPNLDAKRIIAQGRSLGGAAAVILAAERPTAALVLESTFTSVRSFASQFWAPEFLVRDPFDSLSLVAAYGGPLLVLHGERDTLTRPEHARALAAASRRAELHFLPCGHNNCVRPWDTIHAFLAKEGVAP